MAAKVTVGIDLAKSIFAMPGADATGKPESAHRNFKPFRALAHMQPAQTAINKEAKSQQA